MNKYLKLTKYSLRFLKNNQEVSKIFKNLEVYLTVSLLNFINKLQHVIIQSTRSLTEVKDVFGKDEKVEKVAILEKDFESFVDAGLVFLQSCLIDCDSLYFQFNS